MFSGIGISSCAITAVGVARRVMSRIGTCKRKGPLPSNNVRCVSTGDIRTFGDGDGMRKAFGSKVAGKASCIAMSRTV